MSEGSICARSVVLVSVFSLAGACHGATALALVARYGLPVMQQFTAAPNVVVSVEYGADQRVKAVRLAPAAYDPHTFAPDKTMNPEAVSEIAGFFVPNERRARMSIQRECPPGNVRTCTQIETDEGIVITRQQSKKETGQAASDKDLVVTIASEEGLPRTSAAIQARFGSPVTEEFAAEPGIGLTAMYGAEQSANLRFSRYNLWWTWTSGHSPFQRSLLTASSTNWFQATKELARPL